MYLNKQNKKDLIFLIDVIIEDYRLFLPYAILNEKIDLKEYENKPKDIIKNIKALRRLKRILNNEKRY